MCGVAGFLSRNSFSPDYAKDILSEMGRAISHRGPDHQGTWMDCEAGIAFVHQRLSILDLSPMGNQPMVSPSGRFVITYNGELYNFLELKKDIESRGLLFRGSSDTEVLLAAIDLYGLDKALTMFVGMFAFALWDRNTRELYLVRDRMGEKPLYYGWAHDTLLFGSELKALRKHPSWQGGIDNDVLPLYLRYCYIPAPYSIHPGVFKVMPGSYVKINPNKSPCDISKNIYWSLYENAKCSQKKISSLSPEEEILNLENLLKKTIRQMMVSDVPLGAFLSGGIDSTTVVALMQAQSRSPVKTFTIGLEESGYNEAVHAKSIAKYLGTEHTEMYVTYNEAMSSIGRMAELYDEPFADSSQIPTYLVADLAKKNVKVSLSGDGGDELFGGYNRYSYCGLIGRIQRLPWPLRKIFKKALYILSPIQWDKLSFMAPFLFPKELRVGRAGDKLHKLALMFDARTAEEMFKRLTSTYQEPDIHLRSKNNLLELPQTAAPENFNDLIHWMMYMDMINYLPNDILVKVDRATMGVSLEARVPFLDHRIVELSWSIPLSLKIRNGQSKWIIRQILNKYVPNELINRPKMGFAVPIEIWLRTGLRDWAEDLLDEKKLNEDGYFQTDLIRKMWKDHLEEKGNYHFRLWNILMFQSWISTI